MNWKSICKSIPHTNIRTNLSDTNKPPPLSTFECGQWISNEYECIPICKNTRAHEHQMPILLFGRFHEKNQVIQRFRWNTIYRRECPMWTQRRFYNIFFSDIFDSTKWSLVMSCSRAIHKIAKQATICSSFMIAKWQWRDERNARGKKMRFLSVFI